MAVRVYGGARFHADLFRKINEGRACQSRGDLLPVGCLLRLHVRRHCRADLPIESVVLAVRLLCNVQPLLRLCFLVLI